ncbi:rCG52059 [Rattus norvegicus]|uniref:RCG52059 n=1 Tax=Rattus norvegicus TaxID=10116 RepID=A6K3F5_RAT|nr:rCG52059 [Rattus norvegicus]
MLCLTRHSLGRGTVGITLCSGKFFSLGLLTIWLTEKKGCIPFQCQPSRPRPLSMQLLTIQTLPFVSIFHHYI